MWLVVILFNSADLELEELTLIKESKDGKH